MLNHTFVIYVMYTLTTVAVLSFNKSKNVYGFLSRTLFKLDLLMSERAKNSDHFLDFLHVDYLLQCVWSKVPQIDYEPIVKVI
jgi:hypothetical protein